jgi:hypothetical protein
VNVAPSVSPHWFISPSLSSSSEDIYEITSKIFGVIDPDAATDNNNNNGFFIRGTDLNSAHSQSVDGSLFVKYSYKLPFLSASEKAAFLKSHYGKKG